MAHQTQSLCQILKFELMDDDADDDDDDDDDDETFA